MKRLILVFLLMPASLLAAPATLQWDWGNPNNITGVSFNVKLNDAEVATVADPARQVDIDLPPGGAVIQVNACTVDACSAWSEPLMVPPSPSNVRITIQYGP